MRTACLLEYLARKYTLDVIAFREPGALHPRETFPRDIARTIYVVDLPFHAKTPMARAIRNLSRVARGAPPLVDRFDGFRLPIERSYDVAVIEHFWCAGYLGQIRPHARRVVLDLHNIESVLLDRCADAATMAPGWMFRRFAAACRRLESDLLPAFDVLLVTSEIEHNRLNRAVVLPNALPVTECPAVPKRDEIVFSGNMAYHPNAAAAHWFASKIWPIVRAANPELTWRLVGKNPEALRLPNDPRIEITGAVDDSIIEIARAKAAVVPIRSGSGTRFKILEAWAAGTPVVSTGIGAEGLAAADRQHLLLEDRPDAFAEAVLSVVNDYALASRLAKAGRALYEQKYTWPVAWKILEEAGL
jgi:glycosyltransferase involved in cell wall biosynthesis